MAKPDRVIQYNSRGQPLCGALTRKGHGCRAIGRGNNGRCKYHGGKTPAAGPTHHLYEHGKRSKFMKALPAHLKEGYAASTSDPDVLSVRSEMGLMDTRTLELLERLTTGESASMLLALADKLHDMDEEMGLEEPNIASLGGMVAAMKRMIALRRSDRGTWDEIRETMEGRRKLSDTERKLLEAKQAAIDAAELRAIMAFILGSVKEHVIELPGGPAAVTAIAHDVRRLVDPSLDEQVHRA